MKNIKYLILFAIFTFTVSCGQQNRYIQYQVKSGETMDIIAKNLQMKKKDLLRLNPDFDENPTPNSFLVVPEQKYKMYKNQQLNNELVIGDEETTSENDTLSVKEKLLAELKENFDIYEVVKGDTFYNLEHRFQTTKEELLRLNPALKEGLKLGSIIKIREILKEDEIDDFYHDNINPDKHLKFSLLLPFRSELYKNDTLQPRDIFLKNASLVNIATDFYLGAELAVDSLRKKGIDITFNVFDTGNRKSDKISTIIFQENLNSNDVIIGPLYSEDVKFLASKVSVPIIFPVHSNNQSAFSQTNIIKSSPDKEIFRNGLIQYFKENFDEGNLIIVGDDSMKSVENSMYIKNELTLGLPNVNIKLLTPQDGFIEKERFLEILKPTIKNWVILATNNELVVSDVINSLISLPEETTAKVFTFDKTSLYDKIDNRKLAKIGFTYTSEEFMNENSAPSRMFNQQYLNKNNAMPSFYATKGFDITYDILLRLASGNDLYETFSEGASMRVDTKFDYKNDGGYENQGLFILQLNEDLTLTKLN